MCSWFSARPDPTRAAAARDAARRHLRELPAPAPVAVPRWAADVTVIVKAFERPACVAACVASVRRFYPFLPVLVCDDSREPLFPDGTEPVPGVRWLTLPYEAGHTLGAGRNFLLTQVRTPLFFLADDDHVFNEHTRLDVLHGVLTRHQLDIAGGSQERGDYSFAIFEEKDGQAFQHFHRYHERLEPGVVRCDRVPNTFLGRTDRCRAVGWEERVYAAEHTDFFLRAARHGLRTALVGYVYVDHDRTNEQATGLLGRLLGRWLPHRDRAYAWLRSGRDQAGLDAKRREEEFVLRKNGVSAIVHFSNVELRAPLEAELGTPFYGRPPVPPSA